MRLTENVHIRRHKYRLGKYNAEKREYCFDTHDGECETFEIIHPDVDPDDVIRQGDHERKVRLADERRVKRLARRERQT